MSKDYIKMYRREILMEVFVCTVSELLNFSEYMIPDSRVYDP